MLSVATYEHHRLGSYALAAACEAELFGRGGLDADSIEVYLQDGSQCGSHGLYVRRQLGLLGHDGDIGIDQVPATLGKQLHGGFQQTGAAYAGIFGSGVGEMLAYVTQGGCAQQGVTQGVYEHVGIAVAQQAVGVGDLYAA